MARQDTPHRATLSERLEASRRCLFVGRDGEQALWRSALEQAEPAFAVLWVVGPGGVGKSTLFARMAEVARGGASQGNPRPVPGDGTWQSLQAIGCCPRGRTSDR